MSSKMIFHVFDEEYTKFKKWTEKKDLTRYTGAIGGGRFTWSFTPTSLGMIIKVYDNLDKDEIDLTDYDMW